MSKTNIRINSDRIYLRKVELSDVDQKYVDWLNDLDVNQFLETRHETQTIDSVQKYVERMVSLDDELFLAICLQDNHKHIGNIKLGPINSIHKYAEISLFIGDKKSWGKGIATESISTLKHYALNTLQINKLTAGCYSNNIGSLKAFEKAGFKIEGTQKKHYIYKDKYIDHFLLCCFNDKY